MGIDRSRRITFEETVDLFNEVRPEYPDELTEDIIRLSALAPDASILEVGYGAKKAEAQVWEKVCEVVDNPQYLVAQAHQLVEDLRASAANIHEERAKIEKEMEALANERQSLRLDKGELPPPIWKTN